MARGSSNVRIGRRVPSGVAGTTETPTPGGATAGGFPPTARIAVPQGGATAGGPAPVARVPVPQGGAVAGGNPPTVAGLTQTPTPGGAVAGGLSPNARVTVLLGGAIAGGFSPTDGAPPRSLAVGWYPPGTVFSAYPANDIEWWIRELREEKEPTPVPDVAVETQTVGADGTATFTALTPGRLYAFVGLVPTRVQAQWGSSATTVTRYRTFEGAV